MTTKEVNQYLKKYLGPYFELHGFVITDLGNLGYEVIKEVNDLRYRCISNRLRKGKGIAFEAFSMTIWFDVIENYLKDILDKYGLTKSTYTLRFYHNSDFEQKYSQQVLSVEIDSEADVALHAEAVMQYCTHIAFPFFDKYGSLEALNDFIKQLPEKELTYHIGGECQMKKMIVLKWCSDPEYDNYAEYVRQKFESIKHLEDGKYIPLLNAYYELAEKLKQGVS
ncbi:hypothetical protein [Niastella sp. OAS944]|uniref:hypothetical protein n=1 Tax=Niastella sp. OAS944 TaxID=2664089 RepID=UPI00347123DC|nr:hypothetical protein [Chitinophagaceae bacterium OAS944]